MPHIRAVINWREPSEQEVWLLISDYDIDRNGNLSLFRVHYTGGSVKDFHLFQRGIPLLDVATMIFRAGTSLRSAKGLLQDINSAAGEVNWHKKAGLTGLTMGSAAILYEFLKTRPFRQDGYYDGDGNMFLGRVVNTRNSNDYKPD